MGVRLEPSTCFAPAHRHSHWPALWLCLWLLLGSAHANSALDLPSLEPLLNYQPKIPLRIYTSDQVLIGEFGPEKRDFVAISDIPLIQRQALLAIEDTRFYEHDGVDYKGVARAVLADLGGGLKQGASTITMQLARDFFLTKEKLFSRKLTEVMLAYKIESELSKDQILELYMNQVYMGQKAYGFGAAARIYFGKTLNDLSLAQAAMLAGLPQAPSSINPIVNPQRAKRRQQLVLKRMRELNYINQAQYQAALKEDLHVLTAGQSSNHQAMYAAEMVRQVVYQRFGQDSYSRGIKVITTLSSTDQNAAYWALRRQLLAYDQRHGYRGPTAQIKLPADSIERQKLIVATLQKYPPSEQLQAAVVLLAKRKSVRAMLQNASVIEIGAKGLRWANATPKSKLKAGALIWVEPEKHGRWRISQVPNVGAALVALNNQSGAIEALVGGFDFNASEFNHATQAQRQPGSAIKPFIYCAALEKGYHPATLISDAPLTLDSATTGGAPWQPQNDDGVYEDSISLRQALAQSKNVAAVRLLRAITPTYAHDFLARFGFDPGQQPANYTLALGTGLATPLQLASAYSVFANGGFAIKPYLIQKITDRHDQVLFEAPPATPALESARVLDARSAFIADSMLREVIRSGTGALAGEKLARVDLAGKTGTSSNAFDGWFAGYSGATTAVAWMGFDEPRSLGAHEFGATTALPIWVDYMRVKLVKQPLHLPAPPPGVSLQNGDWVIDQFANQDNTQSIDLSPLQKLKHLFGF